MEASTVVKLPGTCRCAQRRAAVLAGHVAHTPAKDSGGQRPAQQQCRTACVSGHVRLRGILVANRGEVAIRVCRAAADLGIRSAVVFTRDDASSQHVRVADQAFELRGEGVAAYLDIEGMVHAAKATGCDAVHPGYGFLSESAAFARRCKEEGLLFIGPSAGLLELFGDKARARGAAIAAGVPVMRGIDRAVSVEEARAFFESLGAGTGMMIKALEGGGGRGSRAVTAVADVEAEFERCCSEAASAFGNGAVFVEELMVPARHIEVQILGDMNGAIIDLGERECSVQRKRQKLIEVAPAENLPDELRQDIKAAAHRLAHHVGYHNVGTFEFLVGPSTRSSGSRFAFIEANARLQVEHTVTEEVSGVDICCSQILLALGATVQGLGLDKAAAAGPRGRAIQVRVNTETLRPDGLVQPSAGILAAYDPPGGPGIRIDGFGYAGYETSTLYDSLLCKVIVHTQSGAFREAAKKAQRALSEFRIEGVDTNIPLLQRVLSHEAFLTGGLHTSFVDENAAGLAEAAKKLQARNRAADATRSSTRTGSSVDVQQDTSTDPLALFNRTRRGAKTENAPRSASVPESAPPLEAPAGCVGVAACPIQGKVVSIKVAEGDLVTRGQTVAVIEAMKMEHDIKADHSGRVRQITVPVGSIVPQGTPLLFVAEAEATEPLEEAAAAAAAAEVDLDLIRPDLELLHARRSLTLDDSRPKAVERRQKSGQRTARTNIADLCDAGSFVEYGALVVARQRRRRKQQWLLANSPADGLISGLCTVNAHLFGSQKSRVMALAYDYTVFAGTQGASNHYKQDRMFQLAARLRIPLCIFTEGGGGRPGDTEGLYNVGMDVTTFTSFSQLSGLVPLVGINSGFCFAGNTALLACCDVIIAAADSTIAMGGPAMIEGGGLGVYRPEDVGPMSSQVPNGVVDVLVKDEAAAVDVAKRYLSYFQGVTSGWSLADQRRLRHVIPESRVRMYDMRELIRLLCDDDSVLELREQFGVGIITALVRVEGVPMGLIANNPHHLAGAIDSPAADKAARFLQLCDAFDLPVISLMDCPGMMVGPEVEKTALVRHCARLYNVGANVTVPIFGIVVRKAYGLGVQAMCGGSSAVPHFTVSWPTGEFYGMNIEGATKLAYRRELEAIQDPQERTAAYGKMVQGAYENAKAITAAQHYGIDDVIDPAESRRWIMAGWRSLPPDFTPGGWSKRKSRKRPGIDTW